jgi:hypothetical protein
MRERNFFHRSSTQTMREPRVVNDLATADVDSVMQIAATKCDKVRAQRRLLVTGQEPIGTLYSGTGRTLTLRDLGVMDVSSAEPTRDNKVVRAPDTRVSAHCPHSSGCSVRVGYTPPGTIPAWRDYVVHPFAWPCRTYLRGSLRLSYGLELCEVTQVARKTGREKGVAVRNDDGEFVRLLHGSISVCGAMGDERTGITGSASLE